VTVLFLVFLLRLIDIFIGGPAGAALAYRLATTQAAPKVLLLEAGSDDKDPKSQLLGLRYVIELPETIITMLRKT
jgi:flavin-dependent dehydrogenase